MNIKKGLITVAIALVFALFVGYGIEVFDDAPTYEQFCADTLYSVDNEQGCVSQGGEWDTQDRPMPVEEGVAGKSCHPPRECYKDFELAQSRHDKIVFIVAIIIGLGAIITGMILTKDAISTGILSGGILLVLYGTIRYWRHAEVVLKFVLLGIALAILIWIGYKKLDKKS